MTPRERAEAILTAMPGYTWSRPLLPIFEAAIIADRRELLAEDDESLGVLCKWLAGLTMPRDPELCRARARHMLAGLRRLRGVEADASNGDK